MYHALSKFIPNSILWSCASLYLEVVLKVITGFNVWVMLEHLLQCSAPNTGDRSKDIQKQIYCITVIYDEYLAPFVNISTVLQKNILLSQQEVSPTLLFEQVITHIMA